MKKLIAALVATTALTAPLSAEGITEFRIGILGGENAQDRLNSHECLKNYTEEALGVPAKLFAPADYNGVIQGLLGGTIDMAWLGASGYAKTYLSDPEAVEPVLVKINLDGSYGYHSIGFARKDSGITSFEQWVEEVKKGDYVMGGTGKGQEDSLVITFLEQNFDLDIQYIPYKGGGAVAKDLAGKQIMATVNNPSEAKGFYEAGDVVPLVAFSDERLAAFPDVPTIKELGKDFSYYNQRAVVGAPGMSDEAAAYYQQLFDTIYNTQEWQDYMVSESLSPLWMGPDEQKAYWQTQVERHKELLAAMGE